jgi:capsular polysaccharide biosynthesis protein
MHLIRGFAQTAADWVAATGQGKAQMVAPPGRVICPVPLTGGGAKLDMLSNYTSAPAYIATLPNACTAGDEGAIITSDGQLLLSTIQRLHIPFAANAVWQKLADPGKTTRFNGRLAVLTHHGGRNFGHWLGDGVPRLWLFRQSGLEPDAWVVPADPPLWLHEMLNRLGIPEERRFYVTSESIVVARQLLVPTGTGFALSVAEWTRTAINDLLQPASLSGLSPTKLWLSRGNSIRRRWMEEPAAKKELEKRGFVVHSFDGASFETQLRAVCHSRVIGGATGSALVWALASCHSNGLLFEVTDHSIDKNDLRAVAAVCGWQYSRTLFKNMTINDGDQFMEELHVPVAEAISALDAALEKWGACAHSAAS